MQIGLPRSDFWAMSPEELSDWYNVNRPRQNYGAMSEEQAKRISDRIAANPDKYA